MKKLVHLVTASALLLSGSIYGNVSQKVASKFSQNPETVCLPIDHGEIEINIKEPSPCVRTRSNALNSSLFQRQQQLSVNHNELSNILRAVVRGHP